MSNKKIIMSNLGHEVEVDTSEEICLEYGFKSGDRIPLQSIFGVRFGVVQGIGFRSVD